MINREEYIIKPINKIKRHAALLFLFILSLSAPAQTTKSCLWQVTGPKGSVYLLGSVHMLTRESYPLNPAIQKAYEQAGALAFEVHLDSARNVGVQQQMMLKAMAGPGETLKERLSDSTYVLARSTGEALGLEISRFQSFKPWFFTLALMTLKLQQTGFQPRFGVDQHFFEKAKTDGKPVTGLETVSYQISLFDSLALENSDAFVRQTLEELDLLGQQLNELVQAWTSGDVAALETLLLESFEAYPDIYRGLIVNRNRHWMPRVTRYLNEGVCALIVVGAGHLLGPDGLPAQLEQLGYRVQQL